MPDNGQIVYFHGIPGSQAELELFGPQIAKVASGYHVVPRTLSAEDPSTDYWHQLAQSLSARFPQQELTLLGFSLGAAAALRVASILGDQVKEIALVSPAAPLELGSYLETMAGAPLFRSAQHRPALFALQCRLQSTLARLSPATLSRLLFASARGADRELWQDPLFRKGIATALRQSIGENRADYEREIRLYVQPWATIIKRITQPVSIDHGALDNWSPVAMAHDLALHLPNCTRLTIHQNLSHYSTLHLYLKQRQIQDR